MWRDLLDKGKCALGYHADDWQYVADAACGQTSRCARCGTVSGRTVHEWSGWQPFDDATCVTGRACRRCQREESREDHAWDLWEYAEPGACNQHVLCSRCRTPGADTRVQHEHGEWEASTFYGADVGVCERCGDMRFAMPDGTAEPVSFQQADAAVLRLASVATAEELQASIRAHRHVLFSRPAVHAFAFAVDQRASTDEERHTLRQLAAVVARCRDEGVDAVFGAIQAPAAAPNPVAQPAAVAFDGRGSPSPTPSALDTQLVGQWRHTESMSSGGFSIVTDTHLVLDASGRFAWWSKSVSASIGTSHSAREEGTWTASNAVLALAYDDGTRFERPFYVEHDAMLMPSETRYRLWKRIG